ncbi:MAG: DUF2828 family protein [Anaeroplasma sp.]
MFIEELQKQSYKVNTKGGFYYGTTFNSNLDLFSMASRYTPEDELLKLFNKAFDENKKLATASILYNLDIRSGKGERRVFKVLFKQLCFNEPVLARKVLSYIPNMGRYDYIFEAYNTPIWEDAFLMIKNQLKEDIKSSHPSLLAKWMPSLRCHNKNNSFAKVLANELGYTEKSYRKILSSLRSKLKIVEKNITNNDYNIDYNMVPSKAMKNYSRLFMTNDKDRFISYLECLKKGETKINTTGLAPYEMVKSILCNNANTDIINQMWANQEDFLNSDQTNVLVVADTSGSMMNYDYLPISAAVGLAVYTASHNKGFFHNKFITFSDTPSYQELKGISLSEMINSIDFDNWGYNTNINSTMRMILNASLKSLEDCPSHLLIISDMEFDGCVSKKPNFHIWKEEYEKYQLKMPKIIFWNVAGNIRGIPVTKNENDVILVSGFSSSIFKGILNVEKFNPSDAMIDILNPYLAMIS